MDMEKIIILESNADHITGEELGDALIALNEMPEILDAVYIPAQGKKNRPCGLIQIMCRPENEKVAVAAFFRHTHVLGVRRQELERYVLPRHLGAAEVNGQVVKAKIHELEGEAYMRPEANELARIAAEEGIGMPALRFSQKKR